MIASKKLAPFLLFTLLLPVSAAARNSAPWVGVNFKGLACTGTVQGYGPWDYTKPDERDKIPVVEAFHFTPEVESLLHGHSTHVIMADIDYTLIAVPNHHRALMSAIRFQQQVDKQLVPKDSQWTTRPECYLQRAIHFSPHDVGSIALYAFYLKDNGLLDKAAKMYEKALEISPDNAKIAYSYALFLIDLKQYDKSVEYARNAYKNSQGKAPKGLKEKLVKLGVWKDQPENQAEDKKTDDKITDGKVTDAEKIDVK